MKNYYQILGLKPNANFAEIKKAYRKHASKRHPDKQDGDSFFNEKFIKLKEAYDILSDPISKSKYDKNFFKRSNSYNDLSKKESALKEKAAQLSKDAVNLYKKMNEFKQQKIQFNEKQKQNQQKIKAKIDEIKEKEKILNEKISLINEQKKREEVENNKSQSVENKVFLNQGNVWIDDVKIEINNYIRTIDEIDNVYLITDSNRFNRKIGFWLIIIGVLTTIIFVGFALILFGLYLLLSKDRYHLKLIFKNGHEEYVNIQGKKFSQKTEYAIRKAILNNVERIKTESD